MKFIKFLVSLVITAGLIYLLNNPLGALPALGKLFNPFEGFWQNGGTKSSPDELKLEGIKDEVSVVFDDNRVPHVFAQNEDDLYFTQGYLVAQDRLWQMEFYTLAASGRLSEVVGERAIELDRYNRRMGMAETAKKIAASYQKDDLALKILNAYAAGVNAYISQLSYRNLPVEYKIIGYRPEEWSPYKTILMLMNMRNVLNGGSEDFRMSNALAKYGSDVIKDLFPDYPVIESPIIPVGTKWEFTPMPVPAIPAEIAAKPVEKEGVAYNIAAPAPEIGSNNWAVGGSKSATGLPILANDPHLQLTLPSIWYQMQLSTPTMNVYGACLPGTPGVTIGFNKDIAWGVTNVGSDVMDFYQIKFKDNSKKEYWYNGAWKATTMMIEEFKIKGKEALKDTVYYTHHGPVLYNRIGDSPFAKNLPIGHAMKWVGHELDNTDLLGFYYLNRATNYDDYRKALLYYKAPAQNFIFADNHNDIAITPNGKLPLKWKEQGKFILDGANPAHDWQGWIPTDQNPTVKNPPRGFVSSANQFSTDPTYPYYMGWKFAPAERGLRINERLEAMQQATVDSLRSVQNDNFNVEARRLLPDVIKILAADSAANKDNAAYQALVKWNMKNDPNEVGPTIFERWVKELRYWVWEDEFEAVNGTVPMSYPTKDRTWDMIHNQPTAKWFDNIKTKDKVETVQDIVRGSFKATIDSLTAKLGPLSADTWAWTKVKSTDISHLGRLPGFGRMDIPNGGGPGIVNATSESHGPSWRMVVQLDKGWPKAYGLYPGGQSGNPGSPYYDNMVDKWANGELNELLFMKAKDEKSSRIVSTTKVKGNK